MRHPSSLSRADEHRPYLWRTLRSVRRHHPFYCEENIWHLCQVEDVTEVVMITNALGRVCLWHQNAAAAGQPVIWDYHVVAAAASRVWDLDTRLGCPVDAARYLDATFATVGVQPPSYDPRFRVIGATDFVRELRTDRRHMRRSDGTWRAPPPPWPTISDDSNLARYLDLDDPFAGPVLDLAGLPARLR